MINETKKSALKEKLKGYDLLEYVVIEMLQNHDELFESMEPKIFQKGFKNYATSSTIVEVL